MGKIEKRLANSRKGKDMAKARKGREDKHVNRVTVRFNDFEYSELKDRAREANLSLAAYIRRQAFYNDTVIHYDIIQNPKELKKLVGELGKISSNLNQIARYFNTGGMRSLAMEDDIHDCIAMLFDLRKKVLKMGGDHGGRVKAHRKQKR